MCFLEPFGFYQACLRTRQLWISSVFVTKEVDGARDKGLGDTTVVDVHSWRAFSGLGTSFTQLPKHLDIQSINFQIIGILLQLL